MEYTPCEILILVWCSRNAPCEEAAAQFRAARPVEREFTGVGSYTNLALPEAMRPIPETALSGRPRGPIMGPDITARELEFGACSHFFLEDGRIKCLEIAAFGDTYPEHLTDIAFVPPGG